MAPLKILLFYPFSIGSIFLSHIILSRCRRTSSPQLGAARAVLLSFVPAALFAWGIITRPEALPPAEQFTAYFYFIFVHAVTGCSYFHLFNMSETARRVRILMEIHASGGIERSRLYDNYPDSDLIDFRLRRLEDMGQLELKNGRYHLRGKLLYTIAVLIMAHRKLLGFR